MAPTATVKVECPECKGTGIYLSMDEPKGTGVICGKCKGTGGVDHTYTKFIGRSQERDFRVIVPNPSSKIGESVRTTALDQDAYGLSDATRAAQRWGVEGTIYDERKDAFGAPLYLVGHRDGPPVLYGEKELEFLK